MLKDPRGIDRGKLQEFYRRLESGHPFYSWTPFKKQADVLLSRARIKALIGANRVGKTETASYMAVAAAVATLRAPSSLTSRARA